MNAQHHQHMFCARLDFALDDEEGGRRLEVVELEVEVRVHTTTSTSHPSAGCRHMPCIHMSNAC